MVPVPNATTTTICIHHLPAKPMAILKAPPPCIFKCYDVSQKTRDWAKRRADELPPLPNSILGNEGAQTGYIGQAICMLHMGCERADEHSTQFDIYQPKLGRIEVKTKQCGTPPEPHFNCSVSCANDTQDCHAYAFMRVSYDKTKAWFLGWIYKDDFVKWRFKLKAGEIDDGRPVRADCWNVRAYQLYLWPESRLGLTNEYFSTIPRP